MTDDEPEVTEDIQVSGGKYTFEKHEGDWRIHVLRHDEPWLIIEKGHNAISSLMSELGEARGALYEASAAISEVRHDMDNISDMVERSRSQMKKHVKRAAQDKL